jgi:predicted dehydrogenase
MSYPDDQLIINRGKAGMLVEERLSGKGAVAYYEGVKMTPGLAEAKHWLTALIEDREPVVRPEQAFVVTQILEAIYQSSEQRREVALG